MKNDGGGSKKVIRTTYSLNTPLKAPTIRPQVCKVQSIESVRNKLEGSTIASNKPLSNRMSYCNWCKTTYCGPCN